MKKLNQSETNSPDRIKELGKITVGSWTQHEEFMSRNIKQPKYTSVIKPENVKLLPIDKNKKTTMTQFIK
jgi:hypothetical protein